MSQLESNSQAENLYETIANSVLKRCRDARTTRRIVAGFEAERERAATQECREGFDLVLRKLREKLAEWPELPMAERAP
jgi:hypothetical protein